MTYKAVVGKAIVGKTIVDKTTVDNALSEAVKWLARLNGHDVTPEQREAFFVWLEASEVNQAAYLKAEQLWLRGDALGRVEVDHELSDSGGFWGYRPRTFYAASAAFMCVLCCVVLFLGGNTSQVLQEQRYTTAVGELREIVLADGTKVVLNTQSELHIRYSASLREVTLKYGEAFFDVESNQHKPFDVVTDGGRIRVLGTRFGVRYMFDERGAKNTNTANVQVTVEEGRVAVQAKETVPITAQDFEAKQVLGQNQQIQLTPLALGQAPKKIDSHSVFSWQKRQLIARAMPLAQVLAELNRYSTKPYSLEEGNMPLAAMEVTAVLPLDDVQQAANILTTSLNLSSTVTPYGYVIAQR